MTKFLFSKNQPGASVRTNASCPPVLGKEAAKYITAFEYNCYRKILRTQRRTNASIRN